ncbi:Fic family protein [Daejeonella sp.]|uniref:Fic family protein n=1 Tax=Daejeonella sp. TaxID=2805397 RepID=UPI002731DE74|nr:Fic/DOC family N-terminal domain-containing protein [Daejeonella sp.]MDP2415405.1 Fic/DOC family N-terminal domain-containing protein [Daejeonella sp.]
MKKQAGHKNNIPFNELPLLPPDQAIIETIAVLRQVVHSSIALAELKGIAYTLPNPSILLNAVILKEARVSSEIENVITTHDKLYQALSATGSQIDHDTKEVLRYREAMLAGFAMITKNGFLNTNGIVTIQEILEENKAGLRRLPGTSLKNAATGEVIYTPPDDYDTILQLMKNLEVYINKTDILSPLIKLAVQHYQFESIHPFYDGNGRTGRIINVLYLCLHGLLDNPVLYLSDYIIKHKADYYRLLGEVKTRGNWEEWVLFILKAVEETSKQTTDQIRSINKLFLELQDKIKKNAVKLYNKELLELLFEQPYCKIEFVVDRLKISRVTASKYLNGLEKVGILQSKKIWKETLYINTELFELLKK